ncbi:MAG: hydroxysteroid dehydrogenase-like protein 2 [Myxococcota bacterium]
MKVAVTGGSGELGTLVLRRLMDDRSIKAVRCLDVRPPILASGKLQYLRADVREDGWEQHLAGMDALIHLAFVVTRFIPREVFDEINVEGSKRVFNAAARVGIKQVVYASSIAAYGVVPGHPVPITEDTPRVHQPDFPYASAKYEVEEFLDAFEQLHPDVAVARMRPAIFIGARIEHFHGGSFKRRLLPDVDGALLPLVWDEDVADAFILALKQRAHGAFNVVADEPVSATVLSQRTALRTIRIPSSVARAVGRVQGLLQEWGLGEGTPDAAWLTHSGAPMVASSRKAREVLGWKPRCNTCVEVVQRYLDTVPVRPDRRILAFLRMVDLSTLTRPPVQELQGITALIHLNLTGPGGGDFGMLVRDGRMRIQFSAPRPPTGTVTMKAEHFLDLLGRRADLTTSQLTGRVRLEGDPVSGFLLGGMITMFQRETEQPGVRGRVVRAFSNWVTHQEAA